MSFEDCPPDVRAHELISRLPGGELAGAEIGVFKGQMSAILLERLPGLTLHMVDSWAPTERQPRAYIECGDYHARLSADKQERCYRETLAAVREYIPRAHIMRMDSLEAASRIRNESLDFVFIDADHSFEGCAADIAVWGVKVKVGGLLCGHDYGHPIKTGFGVKRAVDEVVARYGLTLELGRDMTWFVKI